MPGNYKGNKLGIPKKKERKTVFLLLEGLITEKNNKHKLFCLFDNQAASGDFFFQLITRSRQGVCV